VNAAENLAPLPAPSAAPRAALLTRLALLGLLALISGPLAALALDANPIALSLLGVGALSLACATAGLRGLDLGLLALDLAALSFFTAIRHRTVGEIEHPHPFYDWTLLRLTAPELLALAALLAHALRRLVLREVAPLRAGPVPWLVGGFLALGLLVGLARGNPLEACLRDGRKVAYVALAHLLIVGVADTPQRRRIVVRVVAVALFAASIATVVDYLLGEGFRYNGFLRASVDVSDFLGFLALLCVPAALLRAAPGGAGRRARLLGCLVVASAATLSTFSRAAWCAAPIGLALTLLHPVRDDGPGGPGRRLPRVAFALVLAAAIGAPLLFSGVADRAVARVGALFDRNGDPSVTYRVRELRGAVDVALDHPVAGIGLGTEFDAGAAIVDRRRGSATLVHNLFVWSTVKAGLPGLLMMLGALAFAFVSLSRSARSHPDRDEAGLALGLLGLLATFLVIGMVGAMLNQARTAFLLGTVTGLAQAIATSHRASRASSASRAS
jgi:hypothetical protein